MPKLILADQIEAGQVSELSITRIGAQPHPRTLRYITAVCLSDGRLKLICWDFLGEEFHRVGDFTFDPCKLVEIVDVSKEKRVENGIVVTAIKNNSNKLQIDSWKIPGTPDNTSIDHASSIIIDVTDVKRIAIARLYSRKSSTSTASRIAIAAIGGDDNLKIFVYDINNSSGSISEQRGSIEVGKASEISISVLNKNVVNSISTSKRIVTGIRDSSGMLKIGVWNVNASGGISKLAEATAGTIGAVKIECLVDNKIFSAVKTHDSRLKVIVWDVSEGASPMISRRGEATLGRINEFGLSGSVTAISSGNQNLQFIDWNISETGTTNVVGTTELQQGVRAISMADDLTTAIRTAGGNLKVLSLGLSFPFPSRAEDLEPETYWYISDIHAGGSFSWDIGAVRYDSSRRIFDGLRENPRNPVRNEDKVVYGLPVRSLTTGRIASCWRNAPDNPRPGESHQGRIDNPQTIPRSGNYIVISDDDNRILHHAHFRPASVPSSLCPFDDAFLPDANDKVGDYTIRGTVPTGVIKVREGQKVGEVGNVGASSGPHLHVHHALNSGGDNTDSISRPLRFHGAWVKNIRGGGVQQEDNPNDWIRLDGSLLPVPRVIILPDYSKGFTEIAKRAVPSSKAQFTFDHIKESGYMLEWIDVFEHRGNLFFNFVFRPSTGLLWRAYWNLTSDLYQEKFDLNTGQDFRLFQITNYVSNGQIRYAAVFRKDGGPRFEAYHSLDVSEHQQRIDQLTDVEDFRPKNISVVSINGNRSYAALYEKTNIGSYQAKSFLTPQEYQQAVNENLEQGRQIAYLIAYEHNNQPRFSAIWNSITTGVKARHGLTGSEYHEEWQDSMNRGLLTRFVTGYVQNNSVRYAGVWRR